MNFGKNLIYRWLLLVGLVAFSHQIKSQDYQLIDSLLQSLPTLSGEAEVDQLQQIANKFYNNDTARVYALKAIEKAVIIDYKKGMAKAYYFIGRRYGRDRLSDKSLEFYSIAMEYARQTADLELEGKILGNIGYTLSLKGEMERALEMFLDALYVAERSNNKKMIARSQFELGDFYRLQHDTEKALVYLEKSLNYHLEEKELMNQVRAIYTMGITHKVAKVSGSQERGIKLLESLLEPPYFEILPQNVIGKIYTSLGSMYTYIEDFAKAEPLLLKSLEIKRKGQDSISLAFSLNELATFYLDQNQFEKSIIYAEGVREIVEPRDDIFIKYDNYKNLADAYAGVNQFEKSYEYLKMNYALRDSVINQERILANTELEKKYENAIAQEKIARQDLKLSQQRSQYLFLISISMLIGLLTFIWMRTRLKFKAREAAQLEQLNATKNQLFTNITHELLTPVTLLVNPLRKLQSSHEGMNEVNVPVHQLDMMVRNGERLDRLIHQIMDLSKSDEGKLQLSAKKQDLVSFANNLVESFQPFAKGKHVQLSFFSTETPLDLYFDPSKMEDILINLLSNAIKFSKEEGKVTVLISKENNQAKIEVKDKGIGIAAEELDHIFNRFYQVDDSDVRENEGMGIGLAIVKEMTNLHHGKIEVESNQASGTRFILYFPLGAQHLSKNEIVKELAYQPRKIQQIGNNNFSQTLPEKTDLPLLLIVEDNLDLLSYLCEQLEAQFIVLSASNAHQGLALAIEHIPDLILSDVMMPKMDGFEFCKALKSDIRTNHIPVILLTAKADREQILTGLQTGADDYITKPFDQDVLLSKINNLITQRKKLRLLFAEKVTIRPSDIEVKSVDDKFLTRLIEVAEVRMSDANFGVDELSHEIGMSRSQLYRKLKSLMGESPTVFLRTLRLQRAHQLLLQSAGNATEIAYQVGFNSPNYFFKCFKDHFGMTPKEAKENAEIEESKL